MHTKYEILNHNKYEIIQTISFKAIFFSNFYVFHKYNLPIVICNNITIYFDRVIARFPELNILSTYDWVRADGLHLCNISEVQNPLPKVS